MGESLTSMYEYSLTGITPSPPSTSSYSCSSTPAEIPVSALPRVNFGWHLRIDTCTSTEITVTSRAVAMAVMMETRAVDVKQEGDVPH